MPLSNHILSEKIKMIQNRVEKEREKEEFNRHMSHYDSTILSSKGRSVSNSRDSGMFPEALRVAQLTRISQKGSS